MTSMKAILVTCALLAGHAAWADALHDPTQPPASATGSPQADTHGKASNISVIRLRGSEALAVIDGRTVRIGDRLNGARVQSIDAAGVTLKENGRTRTLPLGGRADMDIRRHP